MVRLAELYGWHAVLTPELLVVAAGIALFYAKAGNVQPNQTGVFVSLRWTRQTAFYTGVVCMYFGYGGILSVLAKQSIDLYVLQLCVRYMCMIPLFIAGTPERMRTGLMARLPGGQKIVRSEKYGMYAALVFFVTLSVILLPAMHNTLSTMVLLRFPVHMLLLASAWFMWESLFHPELIRQQREKFRTQLMVLGSIILFPVCMVMTGSDYMAFAYSHNLVTALCVSPEAERLSIAYGVGSTSAFGGMLLMAVQLLSLALTNRPVKIQH